MKTAIVTGANRGLGLGFVRMLSQNGYRVYAAMRDIRGFELKSDNIIPAKLDVEKDDLIKGLVQLVKNNSDTVSLLINNAGLNKDTVAAGNKDVVCTLDQLDRAALNKMFDVNATSPIILARYITPLMIAGGVIVNISSCRGSFHDENENTSANYGYRASKTALNMLTLAMVEDLPSNIGVVAVHPGSVQTDMNPNGLTSPEEAAKLIYDNIVDSWSPEKTGSFLRTDGSKYPY